MIVLRILCIAIAVYYWIMIARLLMSWFPRPPDALRPIFDIVFKLTEPLLRLARPLIPPVRMGMMAMDLSPLLVVVLLIIVREVVCQLTL